jgi:hypothetical protein
MISFLRPHVKAGNKETSLSILSITHDTITKERGIKKNNKNKYNL